MKQNKLIVQNLNVSFKTIDNKDFKGVEFDSFKKEAGANSFTLSPTKWIENATAEQLVVLANLENLNSEYIKQNIQSDDRLIRLNKVAIEQLNLLIKQYNKLESK